MEGERRQCWRHGEGGAGIDGGMGRGIAVNAGTMGRGIAADASNMGRGTAVDAGAKNNNNVEFFVNTKKLI